ncbi:MAG: 50S ribosomal protein L5 [candidate division Zixibacteria bacterium]|jgi:large subunit ribosomal protein L5|nr:50S ribosomal protein L5 [candidate division Zixibacteria bacterium]
MDMKSKYYSEVRDKLVKDLNLENVMEVPRLQKIVLNMGVGEAILNSKLLDAAVADLRVVAGQQPVIRRAKKSISNFKLREGMPIGCSVTLRRERMYEFFDRLINFALPRVRDFRGIPTKGFDGRGNYTMGVKEQLIFPEIDYDKIDKVRGLSITFVTSSKNDEGAFALLRELGMPFRKK